MTTLPTIVKADGSNQTFDPMRLVSSLQRAGAGEHAAMNIAKAITNTVAQGASSREIYTRAFALLRKEGRPIAARYALRRALLELGPTGHPFEDFISHLYRAEGWQVETRKIMQGKCVMHEVDFYASHPEQGVHIAAELKYHNDPGYKTDLKVALPSDNNLFMHMSRAKVYPLTTLTDLSHAEKNLLIEHGVVAVDEIVRDRRVLDILHLSPERVGELLSEAEGLLAL
ncbi:MAG: hypothetical protein NTY93_03415 [Candidatus Kaiserbacteria bacterium]|nr:hypothetical protein [Candidatus Kaiserbacteria bacterium]